jgi:hypothetical protein
MKKLILAASAFVAGATLFFAATPAMARVDVDINVGVPGFYTPQPVYVQPRPVYVDPRPVYVQPQPVYVQPRPFYQPPPRVVYGPPHHHGWRDHDGRGRHHGSRDRDRDGVPNRYDHRPNDPRRY